MIRALVFNLLCILPMASFAHPLAPALFEITETDAGNVSVLWKTSVFRVPGSDVQPKLPLSCQPQSQPSFEELDNSLLTRWVMNCGESGLVGETIRVDGLHEAKIDVLLRLSLVDGRRITRVLRASDPELVVPERESAWQVAVSYAALGFEHIWTGIDHLLFVFGLLLLASGARALVATVTAFTLGHSVTLSLAALGYTNFPTGPIEVLIALSVLVLAVELTRDTSVPESWLRRFPWVMAASFGLLHGLGFAGALSEVGLPSYEILTGLVSFNIGIELGQLCFVFVVLALFRLGSRWLAAPPAWVRAVPVYAMGSLAAFWCFERTAALF